MPHIKNNGSSWSIVPDWEEAQGLQYDLFTIDAQLETLHISLRSHFKEERIIVEVVDAILGVNDSTSESDRKRAARHAEGYFVEDSKLWKLGGYTPSRATTHWECITKLEATQLARVEHEKLHLHRDLLQNQLLDKIYSPLLDASITTAILECSQCKGFGTMHIHSLLSPITRRRPFKLLVGDYLTMPPGKGEFLKISLYTDMFSQKLWAFKSKSAAGKDTINSLHHILQGLVAPTTFMADGVIVSLAHIQVRAGRCQGS